MKRSKSASDSGSDVINLRRLQRAQSFSNPKLISTMFFDSLEDGRRCVVLRRLRLDESSDNFRTFDLIAFS